MSFVIAEQLGVLYRELAERHPVSVATGVDLTRAPASGRAKHLVIAHCERNDAEDPLHLSGVIRSWSVADVVGFSPDVECPIPHSGVITEEWAAAHPVARFNTDGQRVRFGLSMGVRWYVVREGPLDFDGRFIVEALVDRSVWLPPDNQNPA